MRRERKTNAWQVQRYKTWRKWTRKHVLPGTRTVQRMVDVIVPIPPTLDVFFNGDGPLTVRATRIEPVEVPNRLACCVAITDCAAAQAFKGPRVNRPNAQEVPPTHYPATGYMVDVECSDWRSESFGGDPQIHKERWCRTFVDACKLAGLFRWALDGCSPAELDVLRRECNGRLT